MKKMKNPFLLTGYYGEAYFCDRKEELKVLEEHFQSERNVVIYSWRRMGKTSLIRYYLHKMEKANKAETVYVDLLGTRDIKMAVRQITQAIYEQFGSTSSGISANFQKLLGRVGVEMSFDPFSGVPKFSIGLRQAADMESSLNALGEFLQNRKKTVIVAMDEFQQINNYTDQNGEAVFRSWMQSFPAVRFIFSGSHRNMMASMFSEKNRPFYRSAQLMQLDPIDFEEYAAFIKNHFKKGKKTIEDKAIAELYAWSRKQTYCVQLICNKLYGKYDNIKSSHLPEIYDEIINQEISVFSNFTNLLTDMQWQVLVAIAKEEPLKNPLSQAFIMQHQLGSASSVSTAIKALENKEIIIRDEGALLVHDVILGKWLQRL